MAIDQNDLNAIEQIVSKLLQPITEGLKSMKDLKSMKEDLKSMKEDLKSMKEDLNLLARLNQLDDIRREPRLRKLYSTDDQQEA